MDVDGNQQDKDVNQPAGVRHRGGSRNGRVVRACLWLSLVLWGVFPLFAVYGFSRAGWTGVAAAATAGGICWLGAGMALVMLGLFQGPQLALQAMLGGMFFRLGLPILAMIYFRGSSTEIARAGVLGMLLVYYLIALVTETLLSVRVLDTHGKTTVAKAL